MQPDTDLPALPPGEDGASRNVNPPALIPLPVELPVEVRCHPAFEKPLQANGREVRLLNNRPWVRTLGKLNLDVSTEGWRFPAPAGVAGEPPPAKPRLFQPRPETDEEPEGPPPDKTQTRLRPPPDTVVFKDRLLYLLQPPLEDLFAGRAGARCRSSRSRTRSRASPS